MHIPVNNILVRSSSKSSNWMERCEDQAGERGSGSGGEVGDLYITGRHHATKTTSVALGLGDQMEPARVPSSKVPYSSLRLLGPRIKICRRRCQIN